MANTGLEGPYELTTEEIDRVVTRKSPGTYALGKSEDDELLTSVKYIGRSDDDINDRLHDWVGEYPHFKFGYFDSPKAAFEKECKLWHAFGGPEGKLDNKKHPQRPVGSNWQCPVCDIFKEEGGGINAS